MTQIFKTYLPTTDLLEFLLEICTISTDKYIQFNKNSFKRALYLNAIPAFLEKCKPHYHASKQIYLEGPKIKTEKWCFFLQKLNV